MEEAPDIFGEADLLAAEEEEDAESTGVQAHLQSPEVILSDSSKLEEGEE